MSTSTRRKSHNAITKSHKPRAKKSKNHKRDKRSSAHNIRSHSPQHRPQHRRQVHSQYRHSHQSIQPLHHTPHNHAYSHSNDEDPEHSPEVRPTHKKNAVSSFLSIFSTTFSQSKARRRDSTLSDTIDAMTDLELLKKMKRRILDILSKMLESKTLKKIKSELKTEVWEVQYSELKKRLSTHDIHTATIRQKLASAQSLRHLTSLTRDQDHIEEDDEDIREMATFLLQEYFDQPTQTNTALNAQGLSLPLKNGYTPSHTTDHGSEDSYDDTHDIDESKEMDFEHANGQKLSPTKSDLKTEKRNGKKHIKFAKRDKEMSQSFNDKRTANVHKYSPRPMPNGDMGYGDIPDTAITLHDRPSMSEELVQPSPTQKKGNKKRVSLSLSNIESDKIHSIVSGTDMGSVNKMDQSRSKSPSYSYSTLFNHFLSDNLKTALSKVGTWEFDPFEFANTPEIGGKCLVYSVWYLFDKYELFKLFPSISPTKLMRFLAAVEDGYLDNPYHNKIHATDVVSNVSFYLNNTLFFNRHISKFDIFTAILSAAVHDLGHDGNNNAYHITTMSDLAITYNDTSVLENYHIAYTFRILKKPQCNWYKQLGTPIQRYLRLAMIDIVLATDMKFHNQKLAQLTNLVAILKQRLNKQMQLTTDSMSSLHNRGDSITSLASIPMSPFKPSVMSADSVCTNGNGSDSYNNLQSSYVSIAPQKLLSDYPLYKYKVNETGMSSLLQTEISDVRVKDSDPRVIDVNDERRFILCFLVHLCDISNCAKSLKSGKKWAVRVMTEFFKQGDRERALGLEVSAMMDRRRSSTPQGQIGFIKFILRPSYNMFVRLVPEATKPLEILNENLEYWQIQQKLLTKARKKRAKSMGSLQQNQALMLMQSELKKLQNETRKMEGVIEDENEDMSDLEMEKSDLKTHNTHTKHVGFKEILVIESEMEIMDGNDSEIVVVTAKPRTLSSKSLNIGRPELTQSSSHTKHEKNQLSRLTNVSMDSNGSLDSAKYNRVHRAHSIHVSIPTSEKQIQSQPQPFSEFFAELKRESDAKEDEKYEREHSMKKLKGMTITAKNVHRKGSLHSRGSDGVELIRTKASVKKRAKTPQPKMTRNKPKVQQSISHTVESDGGSIDARIKVSESLEIMSENLSKNKSKNKQVFDVV